MQENNKCQHPLKKGHISKTLAVIFCILNFTETASANNRTIPKDGGIDMNCTTKWEGSNRNPGAMFQAMRNNSRRDGYATSSSGATPKNVVDQYPENNATNVGEFILNYAQCRP